MEWERAAESQQRSRAAVSGWRCRAGSSCSPSLQQRKQKMSGRWRFSQRADGVKAKRGTASKRIMEVLSVSPGVVKSLQDVISTPFGLPGLEVLCCFPGRICPSLPGERQRPHRGHTETPLHLWKPFCSSVRGQQLSTEHFDTLSWCQAWPKGWLSWLSWEKLPEVPSAHQTPN